MNPSGRTRIVLILLPLLLITTGQVYPDSRADETAGGRIPTPDEVCDLSEEDPLIGSIEVKGLERTKRSVVVSTIEVEPGMAYTEEVREEIRQDLLKLGIFDKVEVEPDPATLPSGATPVQITLRERWSLIPIPFFATTSSGTTGGLFVIESNLLGYNKQLITGGAFGEGGGSGLLVYSDPALLATDLLGSVALSYGSSEAETRDLDGRMEESWRATAVSARLRIGYRLSDALSISTTLSGEERKFDPGGLPPGADSREASLFHGLTLSYAEESRRRYFDAGFSTTLRGEYRIDAPDAGEWSASAEFSRNFPLWREHRLGYALRAGVEELPYWQRRRLGGAVTQRSIERNSLVVERYLSSDATYELPILAPEWGTVTILGFYEGGVAEGPRFYHGPGGGARFYVSRITLPAVGFDFAYGVHNSEWLFSFAIGMSM